MEGGDLEVSMAQHVVVVGHGREYEAEYITALIELMHLCQSLEAPLPKEVVKEIEGVPTDGRDKPIDAVRVETITIEE